MAMIERDTHADVKGQIPLLLDKSNPIKKENMWAVLVQFKLRDLRVDRTTVAPDQA